MKAPPAQQTYDLLTTMVALLRADARCQLANSALENTLECSRQRLVGASAFDWFTDPGPLRDALQRLQDGQLIVSRFEATLACQPPATREVPVHVIVSPAVRDGAMAPSAAALVEMIEIGHQARQDREEREQALVRANEELMRNLAHEIRNPLGGIRGAAQLLALEAASPALSEYTDVIIREADRLKMLVERLLAPHRRGLHASLLNIHEVCEHVRTLVLAEFPRGLAIGRDYDASLPELIGDRALLVQALLNIVRNAAQALAARIGAGDARIVLRTRIARQVTLGGRRHRLAIDLQVEDNGPGMPESLRERIFQPLVTGREDGHGLGLTLASAFVQRHGGTIECASQPGNTRLRLLLPLTMAGIRPKNGGVA